MAKKTRPSARPDAPIDPRFAPITAAFERSRDVARKRMFSSSNVLTVNGKIFAMLVKDRLVVKVPKPRVDELTASGRGSPFDPGHGRVMKEWIAVAEGDADWLALAKEAYHFVRQGRS
jgi:TfoX/Sxy family transcriptional regulator of competence genes